MSQDPLNMYTHLLELVEHLDSSSAMEFFKSEGAREPSSKARALIESGQDWVREFSEVDLAKVLFAALGLGGSTLRCYSKWASELEPRKQDSTSKKLRDLLNS
jgi:hypothetical protein